MAHGDAREGKWRGNWWMEWVTSTFHTASEHAVSSIATTDPHTSAAGSRLNWRPRRFKWTRPFHRKTKSGFCACAITFQLVSTITGFAHGKRKPLKLLDSRFPHASQKWTHLPTHARPSHNYAAVVITSRPRGFVLGGAGQWCSEEPHAVS